MILKENNLKGLVLAGGKSSRMGMDKGTINWHGQEQRYYLYELLQEFCDEVFISCREEQVNEISAGYNTITDVVSAGPNGAIFSALSKQGAWLVVACDLPLVDNETLQCLISQRDTSCIATTYESPHDSLPEPLITIWEESAYPVLQQLISEVITCPRKALLRNIEQVKLIQPLNADGLINANTMEDAARVNKILKMKTAAL